MFISPLKISPLAQRGSAEVNISNLVSKYSYLNAWSAENITEVGTTTTMLDYLSVHNLSNTVAAEQPTYNATSMNGKEGLRFNTNDLVTKNVANYRNTDNTGIIDIVFKTATNVTTTSTLFSAADTNIGSDRLQFYINSGRLKVIIAGHIVFLCTTTIITSNIYYAVTIAQTGTTIKIYINGVAQAFYTISGSDYAAWFNDFSTLDNITIGGQILTVKSYSNNTTGFVGYRPYIDDTTALNGNLDLKNYYGI